MTGNSARYYEDYDWPRITRYSITTTDPETILVPILQDTKLKEMSWLTLTS